jgi:toxin ParE1/3/4
MSRRRVIRLRQARRDLVEAAAYLEERSPDAARRFLAAVEETLAGIAATPGIGVARRVRHLRLGKLRMLPVHGFEKHLVFDQETEAGVELVRVLHGTRGIKAILGEED